MREVVACCTTLPYTPSWKKDGGKWYVEQGSVGGKTPTMYRWKPTIHELCESVLGTSIRDASGNVVGVRYPSLSRSLEIYLECLELIGTFQDIYPYHVKSDLCALAMYRRNISEEGLQLDMRFFELARDSNLSFEDWRIIARRMPDHSTIKGWCTYHACVIEDAYRVKNHLIPTE